MKKLLLATSVFVASTQLSLAEDKKFAVLDSNNDGRLSVEEAAADASLSAVFASLDENKDGFLTSSELSKH